MCDPVTITTVVAAAAAAGGYTAANTTAQDMKNNAPGPSALPKLPPVPVFSNAQDNNDEARRRRMLELSRRGFLSTLKYKTQMGEKPVGPALSSPQLTPIASPGGKTLLGQ